MTRPVVRTKKCALCGTVNELVTFNSAVVLGPPDLDWRSAPMARSVSMAWVQECEACGYCAEDISSAADGVAEIVSGELFQELVRGKEELASRFLRAAAIWDALGETTNAGNAYRFAAWVADDADERQLARRWRIAAAERLKDDPGGSWSDYNIEAGSVAIADLWRRAGEWESAAAVARGRLSLEPADKTLKRALSFELTLIRKHDASIYTLGDVPD